MFGSVVHCAVCFGGHKAFHFCNFLSPYLCTIGNLNRQPFLGRAFLYDCSPVIKTMTCVTSQTQVCVCIFVCSTQDWIILAFRSLCHSCWVADFHTALHYEVLNEILNMKD